MNFIFSQLRVLKEQQASDFHATMLALATMRKTTDTLARDLGTLGQDVGALGHNLGSVEAALMAHNRTIEARMDKMEEAVQLLEDRPHAS